MKKSAAYYQQKREQLDARRPHKGLQPQKVTPEMQKFIENNFAEQANDESMYTRRELMRFVSDYMKSQNIQNPENMKMWSGEEKTLKKLFNLKEKWYSFMQVNGILSSGIEGMPNVPKWRPRLGKTTYHDLNREGTEMIMGIRSGPPLDWGIIY